MRTRLLAALLLLWLAGCGGDTGGTQASPGSTSPSLGSATGEPGGTTTEAPAPPTASNSGTRIVAAPSKFGDMLFDDRGQAIYLFDVEKTSQPMCYDDCAKAWPPVLTSGDPVAGPGVTASLLATTERTDGTTQVTYGGHPLYFYAHEGSGEVKCHNVLLNGGKWYVVQPDGDPAPPG